MMTTLQTFRLPHAVTGTESDVRLGHDLVRAWQADGIVQVATDPAQDRVTAEAIEASRWFFAQPMEVKARQVSDLSYSGYIASGEEVTAGEADYSEIFTFCKDLPPADPRVGGREVLAEGEDLGVVGLARGDLFSGGDVAAVGQVADLAGLDLHGLCEEPSAGLDRLGGDAVLGRVGGDLDDPVRLPGADQVVPEAHVGFGSGNRVR